MNTDDFENFREALEKLTLNDASLAGPETSDALGFGFRCGFLGMLHMEIIQERLEREYNLDLITSAPSVIYEVLTRSGDTIYVDNPSDLPDGSRIEEIREPIVRASILVPQEHLGAVLTICEERRGRQVDMQFVGGQVSVVSTCRWWVVLVSWYQGRHQGLPVEYAFDRFETSACAALMPSGDPVDALALIVHRDNSQFKGRELVEKMKELIPRQMYDVAIQAAIGAKIVARSNVKALRKDVTAKCYGGDVSRKKKLLEKQKEGKKRMKQVGRVEIPQEAFIGVLKINKE